MRGTVTTKHTSRLGFIGFGIMGERLLRAALTHDPAVLKVSGIFDPSAGAAVRLQAIAPELRAFASAADVIAESDCLHIASPPASHLGYLRQCHAAGKAALCEKPLAIDVAAATTAVRELNGAGMRAAVNFPFTSSFGVDAIAQWMADGTVGVPKRLDIDTQFAAWPRPWQMDAERWLDARAEGGFVREVVSHFLFLARRQLGPLQLISARTSYPVAGRSERGVEAELMAGEVPVRLRGGVGTTDLADHNLWTLTGEKGRVRLRDWSIAEEDLEGIWTPPGDAIANEKMRPLVLARQLDKVAAMTRGEPTNLATLAEALEVQSVIEAILRAE
jgi:predicted dehydrogenase